MSDAVRCPSVHDDQPGGDRQEDVLTAERSVTMPPRQRDGMVRMDLTLQLDIIGDLNPGIFKPTWFANEGLLRFDDTKSAEMLANDRDYVSFQTPDFIIDVNRQRFQLFSRNQALDLSHRDLLINMFHLLRHTPLTGLAITRHALMAPPSGQGGSVAWDRLMLIDPWRVLIEEPTPDRVTFTGDGPAGYSLELTAETSLRQDAPLLIRCTYQRELPETEKSGRIDETVRASLTTGWDEVLAHTERTIDHLSGLLWQPEGQ